MPYHGKYRRYSSDNNKYLKYTVGDDDSDVPADDDIFGGIRNYDQPTVRPLEEHITSYITLSTIPIPFQSTNYDLIRLRERYNDELAEYKRRVYSWYNDVNKFILGGAIDTNDGCDLWERGHQIEIPIYGTYMAKTMLGKLKTFSSEYCDKFGDEPKGHHAGVKQRKNSNLPVVDTIAEINAAIAYERQGLRLVEVDRDNDGNRREYHGIMRIWLLNWLIDVYMVNKNANKPDGQGSYPFNSDVRDLVQKFVDTTISPSDIQRMVDKRVDWFMSYAQAKGKKHSAPDMLEKFLIYLIHYLIRTNSVPADTVFDKNILHGNGFNNRLTGRGLFSNLAMKAYRAIANKYRRSHCPGSRPLEQGELHFGCSNWSGPGTQIDKAEKYPSANAADECARIHDYAYQAAQAISDPTSRAKAIRLADDVILECLGKTNDGFYTTSAITGIKAKMTGEDMLPSLVKSLTGNYFGMR